MSSRGLRLAFAASILTLAAATAGAAPIVLNRGASVEGITEYRLANGLRVLLFPDPSKATTTVNVTYLVGSRHEGYGESGMAHLLEHMVFKGTPKHPNIPQELTAHGTRPNGSTWYDRTNYFETFAASEENLRWALDLEADRMVNSFIAKKDLDSEFSVVRNEFELVENSPQSVLFQRVVATMYLWHNYGKASIGSRADLERVPIDRLQAFYKKWYQPDNAVLIVAGKFDEMKTMAMVAETFGRIPKPDRVLEATYTVEPPQDGERAVTLRRVGDVQAVAAGCHVPASSHADYAAIDVLTTILSDTPNGRLHKTLVEAKKASSIFGFTKENMEPTFVVFFAQLREEQSIDEARSTLLQTLSAAATTPPSDEELQRAKNSLLTTWESTMRNSEQAAVAISEWIGVGDWRLIFLHRDRLEAVTAADVTRVASAYLGENNRTVGVFIPTKEPQRAEIPPPPDVAALANSYKGRAAMAQGEAFDPAPGAIEARLERSTLPAGAKLTLLPKKTRGAMVNVAMTLRLGNERSLRGRTTAGELLPSMLLRGTTEYTREQIAAELDQLKTQLTVFGGPSQVLVNLETTRPNLEAALRLAAEVLRQPTFPPSEFELLRQEQLTAAENSKADPTQKAFTAFQRHLHPWPKDDPRYTETIEESIETLKAAKLGDVQAFHRDFYGASAGEIAVVGDFDEEAMHSMLTELFGDWKSATPFERLAGPFQDRPAVAQRLEVPDKENAFLVAGLNLAVQDTEPDYPALVLGNFMTGGGFLNSRLSARLRQKEGFSYGAGSTFNASPFEKSGGLFAYALFAPQNGEKLEAAMKEEFQKVLEAGFTEQEIAEAKKGWLQQRDVSRGVDAELARALATRDYQQRTLAFDADLEAKVRDLTAAEILAAMRKHLSVDRMTFIQAGDFAKVAKPSD